MASSSRKPLPPIPKPIPPPPSSPAAETMYKLSTDNRKHLQRIIQWSTEEDGLDGSWREAVEVALDELGGAIVRGGWLTGIKVCRQKVAAQRRAAAKVRRSEERNAADKARAQKPLRTIEERAKNGHKQPEECVHEELTPPVDEAQALTKLKKAATTSFLPAPILTPKHLLLTVAPHVPMRPTHDFDFEYTAPPRAIHLTTNTFSLPSHIGDDSRGTILFGFNEWPTVYEIHGIRVVGGTFKINGVSASLYQSLIKILRICIFTQLSLILEEHLLKASHIELSYPLPNPKLVQGFIESPFPLQPDRTKPQATPERKSKASGIWAFLSKKTEDLVNRAPDSLLSRTVTIDIGSMISSRLGRSSSENGGDGSGTKLFPFTLSDPASNSHVSGGRVIDDGSSNGPPFENALKKINQYRDALSTTPGIVFNYPRLILQLAEKEKQDPSRRVNGEERLGLESVLGWEGRDHRARGMIGSKGFATHQGLTVLHSSYIPIHLKHPAPAPLPEDEEEQPTPLPCIADHPITYRYFSRSLKEDRCLGEFVEEVCEVAEDSCSGSVDCEYKNGEHEERWIHNGLCVTMKTGASDWAEHGIGMWETCTVCGSKTDPGKMDAPTYLMSFGKYLEILLYSSRIRTKICEHSETDPLSISRHFAFLHHELSLTMASIGDVLEIRLPIYQVRRSDRTSREQGHQSRKNSQDDKAPQPTLEEGGEPHEVEDRDVLMTEMHHWWSDFEKYLEKLNHYLIEEVVRKALPDPPRAPSCSPATSPEVSDTEDSKTPTMRSSKLPPLPPSQSSLAPPSASSVSSDGSGTPSTPKTYIKATDLFAEVRHQFSDVKHTLFRAHHSTPSMRLNDLRRCFKYESNGAAKRLKAWQTKHAPNCNLKFEGREPEWWRSEFHVIPKSRFIVKEGEWGSMIAFTLGSIDYSQELSSMSSTLRSTSPGPALSSTPPHADPSSPVLGTSFFSSPLKAKKRAPNPDDDCPEWHEAEKCVSVITRREHPKEATGLMTYGGLRRKGTATDSSASSRFRTVSTGTSRLLNFGSNEGAIVPASAWARPAVQVNMAHADGQVSESKEASMAVEQLLFQADQKHPLKAARPGMTRRSTSATGISHSSIGMQSSKSTSGIPSNVPSTHPLARSSSTIITHRSAGLLLSDVPSGPFEKTSSPRSISMKLETSSPSSPTHQGFASSLTSTLTHAVRLALSTTGIVEDRKPPPASPPPSHHALLAATPESSQMDERPHVKYESTIANRMKFSTTVYYAKQFETLRRRCGIADDYAKSLAKTKMWNADGGKSKSSFWKSDDNRLIIKTLVSSWNVADLQVLIALSPPFFRYMDSTASNASAGAKLLGFYTVEMTNLEAGGDRQVIHVMVMENIFFNREISETYDLKGIVGRKLKNVDGKPNRTLFDYEWVQSQKTTPLFVQPHSLHVLLEAVKADAEFLAKCFIMDYSLLVGIDRSRLQLVCGLVDTIGSFSLAKTLEWKFKQSLNNSLTSGKEVTVIPPHEYQERFVRAMNCYFIPCPDKWTKPHVPNINYSSVDYLPSVI
ncbi:hypothetical protein SISNIDRAFT_484174 [Sistotremastrum niveocremeum HHB9708]|uniref:PIPK domain-containing protein n=2 Tax=Sistotremastraceae TaxID=3402574 RepID=A0A164WSM6_9AGAM|nr:hypothetical protein SISNIDRAFT_484174 [Sistotremastrum niveocremeum HHB9708]KZT38401.1 hypothetical protein SISSUDRAFT_1062027 [Sistotremastrum suecicum HHB10207 ss-3]